MPRVKGLNIGWTPTHLYRFVFFRAAFLMPDASDSADSEATWDNADSNLALLTKHMVEKFKINQI